MLKSFNEKRHMLQKNKYKIKYLFIDCVASYNEKLYLFHAFTGSKTWCISEDSQVHSSLHGQRPYVQNRPRGKSEFCRQQLPGETASRKAPGFSWITYCTGFPVLSLSSCQLQLEGSLGCMGKEVLPYLTFGTAGGCLLEGKRKSELWSYSNIQW